MNTLCLIKTFCAVLILSSVTAQASTQTSYFFHCDPKDENYQIGFHPNPDGESATQKHQGLDKYSSINEENTVTQFSITNEVLQYTKSGSKFEINRESGEVSRDNQASPLVCKEVGEDLVAAAEQAIKTAKTTKTEFWSMTTGMGDTDYVRLGMLATSDDICQVLEHPLFKYSQTDYQLVDRVNSDFSWGGIQAASLWINRKFKENRITMRRFGLMKNIQQAANDNMSACLAKKEQQDPGFYRKLTRNFLINLGYRGVECHKQAYRIEQDVDDQGNLIDRKVPIGTASCIDFNFNSGRLNDWNPSTFTLMLIWKEAHPVLEKIFDGGTKVIEERMQIRLAQQQAEAERQKAYEQMSAQNKKAWDDYQARNKTLMEQVYNLATSGFIGGSTYQYWIEEKRCQLTNGNKTIDNRNFNMTAFRIQNEFIGSQWAVVSSDLKTRLVTFEKVPVDRLQKAWRLAFDTCPGKQTRF